VNGTRIAKSFPSLAWAAAAVVCIHVIVGGELLEGLPAVLLATAWAEAACRLRGLPKVGITLAMGAVLVGFGVAAASVTGVLMCVAGVALVAAAVALRLSARAERERT
jgi:hypothetical protein